MQMMLHLHFRYFMHFLLLPVCRRKSKLLRSKIKYLGQVFLESSDKWATNSADFLNGMLRTGLWRKSRMHILEIQQNKLDKLFFDFYRDSSQSDVSWKAVPLYAVLHCRLRGALAIKT